jgi:ribosome-associated protein
MIINSRIQISDDELRFTFVRSSGPGGQNVNKVNTKAVLRWSVGDSRGVPEDVRARFVERFPQRVTGEGEVVIASQRFRDQRQNERDCLEKLREMLLAVANPPKRRRKTRPTRASVVRRQTEKRAHGQKKRERRRPGFEE